MPAWLAASIVMLLLGGAAVSDVRRLRVPGWWSLGGIATGVTAAAVNGIGTLEGSLIGLAVGALLLLPFVLKGWAGPADSLLLGAVGAWEGWSFALLAAFCTSAAGLAFALIALRRGQWIVPYVPAIAVGTAAAFLIPLFVGAR